MIFKLSSIGDMTRSVAKVVHGNSRYTGTDYFVNVELIVELQTKS